MSDEGTIVSFSEYTLDRKRCELSRAGHLIPLRPKTLGLLIYLVDNRDRVVPKQELLRALWPGLRIEMQGVYQSVAELRAAFGDCDYIRTVRSIGYQWTAELRDSPEPTESAQLRPTPPGRAKPAMVISLVVLVIVLMVPAGLRWPGVATSVGDPEVLVERARTHFVQGEFEAAGDILSVAVAGNPQHLGARLGLAQVHYTRGNDEEALKIARKLHREAIGTGAPQIRMESAMLLSDLQSRREDRATARVYAREAVELATRFHNPLVAGAGYERLGDIYLAEGQNSLARIQLSEAASRYRDHCPSGEKRVSSKLELLAGGQS